MIIKFIIVVFLIICSCCTILGSSVVNNDIFDTAADAIILASSGAADVLLALGHLNPKAAIMMKLIIPIGGVVAKEINPKKGSATYEQLEKLRMRTEGIWKQNSLDIEIASYIMNERIAFVQYYDKVTERIDSLKNLTDIMLNPKTTKSDTDVKLFKEKCADYPPKILNYLRRNMVDACPTPISPSEVELVATKRHWLIQAYINMCVEEQNVTQPDIGNYIIEFSDLFDRTLDKNLFNIKNSIALSRKYATYEDGFNALFKEIIGFLPPDQREAKKIKKCFLRDFLNAVNYDNVEVDSFALQLRDEIIDLLFSTSICAKFLYGDDEESIREYSSRISNDSEYTTQYIANWLNQSLASSWPSAHFGIITGQIIRTFKEPVDVNSDNIKKVIELSLPKIKSTGIKNFNYQILISEKDVELFEDGDRNFCSHKNEYGFNIILSRFYLNKTETYYKRDLNSKLVKHYLYGKNMEANLTAVMDNVYNADTLVTVAEAIKKEIPEIISEQHFKCWAILRVFASWPLLPCPDLIFAKSDFGRGVLKASPMFSYKNGTLFRVCEDYKFVFFI